MSKTLTVETIWDLFRGLKCAAASIALIFVVSAPFQFLFWLIAGAATGAA
jgi:hypothetical protein